MSITLGELAERYKPKPLSTEGDRMFRRYVDLSKLRLTEGDQAIRTTLERLFKAKNLDFKRSGSVLCWSDVAKGRKMPGYPITFPRLWFMGVMYKFSDNGQDIISHFFIREFVDHNAPLDTWRDDLVFPYGVRQFSVVCILPEGYELSKEAKQDYQNQSVVVIPWDKVGNFGVDMLKILPAMNMVACDAEGNELG